jgi:hypothetical protein
LSIVDDNSSEERAWTVRADELQILILASLMKNARSSSACLGIERFEGGGLEEEEMQS